MSSSSLYGTNLVQMCSDSEVLFRERACDIHFLEATKESKDISTASVRQCDRLRMVKKFTRSSADGLSFEVRSPEALVSYWSVCLHVAFFFFPRSSFFAFFLSFFLSFFFSSSFLPFFLSSSLPFFLTLSQFFLISFSNSQQLWTIWSRLYGKVAKLMQLTATAL